MLVLGVYVLGDLSKGGLSRGGLQRRVSVQGEWGLCPGDICLEGGGVPEGVCVRGGLTPEGLPNPPVDRMTYTCVNITFPCNRQNYIMNGVA